jgi:hypothetical protein
MIYEDKLPVKNIKGTFLSASDRLIMTDVINSVLFPEGNGNDVAIENGSYNLLSHLKLKDLHPYNASKFSDNPYKGLPLGFLLYRTCYPIVYSSYSVATECSSTSTKVNIRVYKLSDGAYLVNKTDKMRTMDHDQWREVAYYNYVKDNIIKEKVSPNFVIMYGYNITLKSQIDFDSLKMLHKQNRAINQNNNSQMNNVVGVNQYNNPQSNQIPANTLVPTQQQVNWVTYFDPITGSQIKKKVITPQRNDGVAILNNYTGKVLVCITESPEYSIIKWAKKEYDRNKAMPNVMQMTNIGYHTPGVWMSILFQLMVALYTMQIKGIVINNFDIERNVFIKDIRQGGPVTHYWKYKVEGIEYYIPNYGYLLLIDTNYRDFDIDVKLEDEANPNRMRKLDGIFVTDTKLTINDYVIKTFEMFKKSFDPDLFDQNFVRDGGVKPSTEILKLLTNIKNDADAKVSMSISYYIRKYMTMFVNNRIGTPLNDLELSKVIRNGGNKFRKGQIVVYTESNNVDCFVIYVNTVSLQSGGMVAKIITKDGYQQESNYLEKTVAVTSLFEYSPHEQIKQTFKNESNLNEDLIIETYNVE